MYKVIYKSLYKQLMNKRPLNPARLNELYLKSNKMHSSI